MSYVLHGFLCPKCQGFTSSARGWRPECRLCGYREPAHCAVCRSEQVAAVCPEHGARCAEHVGTHSFCKKLVLLPVCPECAGRTVEFRGAGLNMQHRICSRWEEPGHKSWEEVQKEVAVVRDAVNPSGRYA